MNYQSSKNKKCDFCFSHIFDPAMAGSKMTALPCAAEPLTHQSFLNSSDPVYDNSFFEHPGLIKVIQADITTLQVDAIVNAANESLLGGGGVDGAIHRAAGSELRKYNMGLGGCITGAARLSPGFKLPAQWIIHTVGPVWKGGNRGEADLLASCYREVFRIAIERKVKVIAFPAISTGIYGYPKEAAAEIALSIMLSFENNFTEIIACCFSAEDVNIYNQLIYR